MLRILFIYNYLKDFKNYLFKIWWQFHHDFKFIYNYRPEKNLILNRRGCALTRTEHNQSIIDKRWGFHFANTYSTTLKRVYCAYW